MDTDMFSNSDRVLVAVMNNPHDFEIAQDEGWYRVPVKHAPPNTTDANVLAFYFTKAFGDQRWSVQWYGPIRGHELVRRRDIIPHEPDHPRANEAYYQLQLGPLARLDQPIPSLRWRRIAFISTTWDRFTAAQEINDLYTSGADGLYVTLRDDGFCVEREFSFRETGGEYTVDLAIHCRDGVLPIVSGDRPGPSVALRDPGVEEVCRAVKRLGGELELLES